MSEASARIHPIRSPPQTVLPSEPTRTTAVEANGPAALARASSIASSAVVSSMTRMVPARCAASAKTASSLSVIERPVGF